MNWLADFIGDGIPKIIRSSANEATIGVAGGTITQQNKFDFPDDQNVRQDTVKVYGIQVFSASYQQVGLSGNSVIPDAAIPYLLISVTDASKGGTTNRVDQQPAYDYVAANNTGYTRMFQPFDINLVSSKVLVVGNATFVPATVLPTPPYAMPISILYFGQSDVIDYLTDCGASNAEIEEIVNSMYPSNPIKLT